MCYLDGMKNVSKLFSKLFRTIWMILAWPFDRFLFGDIGLLYLTPDEIVARAAKRGCLDELANSVGQSGGSQLDDGSCVYNTVDDAMIGFAPGTPESLIWGPGSNNGYN